MQGTAYVKLHETSAFRMALRFAGLYSLIAIIALSSVYFVTLQEFKAQVDRELVHEVEELTTHYNQYGKQSLIQHIKNRQQYGRHLHHYYAVADLKFNHLSGNNFLTTIIESKDNISHSLTFFDAFDIVHDEEDDSRLRIVSKKLDTHYLLTVGQSNSSIEELQEYTLSAVFIAVIVTILLTLAIGIYMSKQALNKISKINYGLEESINSNFKQHLIIPTREDEFHELTLKLNLMLGRIESLITGMRRVTDNIAHDLRSPLTRLRNRLEVTLLQSRTENEYRHAMEKAIDDSSDLLKTFNSLLSIAQAEAGVRQNDWNEIDLAALIDELAELYQMVAEEQKLTFKWVKPESIKIKGNRQLLAQAISNLLENAIKYTPSGGTITLATYLLDDIPLIEVSDTGPGIPDKDKATVIERFQRLDGARSSPGNGLGLSLVSAVSKLHHATLILSDNNPGLRAQIRFDQER